MNGAEQMMLTSGERQIINVKGLVKDTNIMLNTGKK